MGNSPGGVSKRRSRDFHHGRMRPGRAGLECGSFALQGGLARGVLVSSQGRPVVAGSAWSGRPVVPDRHGRRRRSAALAAGRCQAAGTHRYSGFGGPGGRAGAVPSRPRRPARAAAAPGAARARGPDGGPAAAVGRRPARRGRRPRGRREQVAARPGTGGNQADMRPGLVRSTSADRSSGSTNPALILTSAAARRRFS
ncbi:hypothetical protein FMEAI12_3740029 [Parafrankia sp. Ea1.12]|nr:hypothetical protein FMEAI12_3740029 [Parafrankia sp. Ea1.12]